MTPIRLRLDDCWEIDGEYYFLKHISGGFLHFSSERTGEPYQVELDCGAHTLPSAEWLTSQFAKGLAHRLDAKSQNPDTSTNASHSIQDTFETLDEKDPRAKIRLAVVTYLDKLQTVPLSDQGMRETLLHLWASRPSFFEGHKLPGSSTAIGWWKMRGTTYHRSMGSMVSHKSKTSRRSRYSPSIQKRMMRAVKWYWAAPERSQKHAYVYFVQGMKRINARLSKQGIPPLDFPGKTSFNKNIRRSESYEFLSQKFGIKAAKQKFQANRQGLYSPRPLGLASIDHTQVDVQVVVLHRGKLRLVGRPWLTLIVDIHTRCILGWYLTFEHPSVESAMACIRHANRPKIEFLSHDFGSPELANIYGKPDEIIADNGWEFTGTAFEYSLISLGMAVRWAPIHAPQYKAKGERAFYTLNEFLFHRIAGRTYPIAQMREWGLDPAKDAVVSLRDLQNLLAQAISVYHQSWHSSLEDTPLNVWTKGTQKSGIPVIGDDRNLEQLLGSVEQRRLTRSGIQLHNLQYHDPEIVGPLLERIAARQPVRDRAKGSANPKVRVIYNKSDLGQIHVVDPITRFIVTLPSIDPNAAGTSLWMWELQRKWTNEDKSVVNEIADDLQYKLINEIESIKPPGRNKLSKKTHLRLEASLQSASSQKSVSLAFTKPTPHGTAPAVPIVPLAAERTDGHPIPVREQRGKAARKPAKSASTSALGASSKGKPLNEHDWLNTSYDEDEWEELL